MKSSNSQPDSFADEQAALWAAKLDGSSLTVNDRAALDAWLAENAAHRGLLSQYCQFSADLEAQLPVLVASGAISLPAEKTPARHRTLPRVVWFATSLAAAAAVTVGIWVTHPTQQKETIATSVAQRKTLKLADGSSVELNARTSLLVDIGGNERHVRMADGEAFFTVAKDKSRPFIVETPAGSVRVTGTVFDVHAETGADFAVTVVEGSVQVSPSQTAGGRSPAPVSLRAHDQLSADANSVSVHELNENELEAALAWRQGEIVFVGTPLSSALAQFSRYHGQSITAAPQIAQLRVGGRFTLDNLDGFLTAIEAVLPVQVSHESSGAILVSPRTGG